MRHTQSSHLNYYQFSFRFRLIIVKLPTEATGWQPRFHQLCDLRNGLKRKCILSLCELSPVIDNCASFVYTNTVGTVSGLEVDLLNGVLLNTRFTIQLEVENPITKSLVPCAANSVTVLKNRIVVAGDDGSIRLADFEGSWIASAAKHFAAVVKVISLDNQSHLLSLGADHRLLMWNLTENDQFSVVSELTLTGLGDPQNVSVVACRRTSKRLLAMVCGSGVQLCHFKL
ncbi:unnamed protein product [Rodentolepis nana]|uniref:Uncharacterized protein n=1 Tax=Rodentolepis nana TaxID=102285 RepID=A0A3P7V9L6_RODNA|nr:unnamed protein product [Rodentolepis nana]